MVIALRVGQFWSEIKLVITNRTPATRSCDFVITRLTSDQIALHSVQLPLYINISMYTNDADMTSGLMHFFNNSEISQKYGNEYRNTETKDVNKQFCVICTV